MFEKISPSRPWVNLFINCSLGKWIILSRLTSGNHITNSIGMSLDTLNDDDNNLIIWNNRSILIITDLYLIQFRHQFRPLVKGLNYAELFIYDKTQ